MIFKTYIIIILANNLINIAKSFIRTCIFFFYKFEDSIQLFINDLKLNDETI